MHSSNTEAQDASLKFHTATPAVTPFWQRIPKFFLFPFHLTVLAVIVALALSSFLLPLLPMPRPFDLIVGEALIWLAAMRHAFNVMERTSQGFLSPDQYPPGGPDPGRVNLPWKLLAIFIIWGFIIGAVSLLSSKIAIGLNLFTTLAMPATVMALSATGSMREALNPLLWFSIMSNVGKPYIALFVFLLFLSSGAPVALPIVMPMIPQAFALSAINFVFLYFNLVMFVMMGYVLYQYHAELGVNVRVLPTATGKSGAPIDITGEQIGQLVAEGNLQDAIDLAYEEQRMDAENIVAQDRYHKLLLLAEQTSRAKEHAQRYINTLLRLDRNELALEVFKRMRGVEPEFMPGQSQQLLVLAKQAVKQRDPAFALSLVRGFDKRNPGHPDIPGVYLLSAQVMADSYRKDDLARAILRGMLQKYPDHALSGEATALLRALENLAAKAAPAAS